MRSEAVVCRQAKEADLDRIIEVHMRSFPDDRDAEARKRGFRESGFGPIEGLVLAESGGVIVAHAFLFDMDLGCLGALVPAAGIASVGVAPEVRGQGMARHLMNYMHETAKDRGRALSVLFPFREGFYRSHGYGKTTTSLSLECAPEALAQVRGTCTIRAATGADRPEILALHERALRRGLGRITRTPQWWNRFFLNERRYILVAERGARIVGLAGFMLDQAEAHAHIDLRVQSFLVDDDDAERSLLAAIGAQRDQVQAVFFDVPKGSPWPDTLHDLDRRRPGSAATEHAVGQVVAGPMVRVLDFSKALSARPLTSDGLVSTYVREEDATYTLSQKSGVRTTARLQGRHGEVVAGDRSSLSSLFFGGVPISSLARAGLVEAPPSVVENLGRLLGREPFFGCDPF